MTRPPDAESAARRPDIDRFPATIFSACDFKRNATDSDLSLGLGLPIRGIEGQVARILAIHVLPEWYSEEPVVISRCVL